MLRIHAKGEDSALANRAQSLHNGPDGAALAGFDALE
jgi:hypothetical protein